MARKEVGKFYIEGGQIYGPAAYMQEWGNEKLEQILSGKSEAFMRMLQHQPDIEMAILVAMQTDYAGWRGHKEMEGWCDRWQAERAGAR